MKNRITVIPETFQKSIYYILLRGRPSKDKSQTPINLSKVVQGIIKLSERMLRKQARMAALPAALPENIGMDISSENADFLHSHIICLSIGCLIDLCIFIQQHLNIKSKKRQQSSQRQQLHQQQQDDAAQNADQEPELLNVIAGAGQEANAVILNQEAPDMQPEIQQPPVPVPVDGGAEIGLQAVQPPPVQVNQVEGMIIDDQE